MNDHETAQAPALQAVGLGLEVAETGSALGRDDEDGVVVPGCRQAAVEFRQALALQSCTDLALLCLQIAQGVVGVDGVDHQAQAVLRAEGGYGAEQQLDAGA